MISYHCYFLFVSNQVSIDAEADSDGLRWFLLRKKIHEDRIRRAFDLFRSDQIEPILIKGWAAAMNYPADIPRHFNDTDLAVAAGDYERAARLTGSAEAGGLIIDLHRELRYLDTVPWSDLFDNSRLTDLDGMRIRILRPEDHLRVLCVHWLADGGANKQRLWDIYYAVANRPSDFDWDRCLLPVARNRRRWIVAVIGIAHRYLGLDLDGLPIAGEAENIPGWMTQCIEAEWHSDVRLEPVVGHLGSPASLIRQLRKRLPPNPIRATVEMEGSIDARSRAFYQLGCMAKMLAHPRGTRPAWATVDRDKQD